MKSPLILTLAAALLAPACTSTTDQPPPPSTTAADSQTLTIFLFGNDNFTWDGWDATSTDIPNLVHDYHPQTIIIRGHTGSAVDYTEALRIRANLLAAGVKNVQIASGGFTSQ